MNKIELSLRVFVTIKVNKKINLLVYGAKATLPVPAGARMGAVGRQNILVHTISEEMFYLHPYFGTNIV